VNKMKKILKIFTTLALAFAMCCSLAACDLFGPSEPAGPPDYTPKTGNYTFGNLGSFYIKQSLNAYEQYTNKTLDEILEEYEDKLKLVFEQYEKTWFDGQPPFLAPPFGPAVDSIQRRFDDIWWRLSEISDRDTVNTRLTLVLTVDENSETGTINFRTGANTLSNPYVWLYDDIPFSYNDEGLITITSNTPDAQELKLEGFVKFEYKNGTISITFDVGGYLRAKAGTIDGWTATQRNAIPYFTIRMTFR